MWTRNLIDYISYTNVCLLNPYSYNNNVGNTLNNKLYLNNICDFPHFPHPNKNRWRNKGREGKWNEGGKNEWKVTYCDLINSYVNPQIFLNPSSFHTLQQHFQLPIISEIKQYTCLKVKNVIFLNVIRSNMDRPRDCHTKWSQKCNDHNMIIWYHWHVESKIPYTWTYLQNRKRLRHRNKLMVTRGEREGGGLH